VILALLVQGDPSSARSSAAAIAFAEAARAAGHTIPRVFFYGDGVRHGDATACADPRAADTAHRWQALAHEAGTELICCVGSAARRGLRDPRTAEREGSGEPNLLQGFELSGLGQLVDATLRSDRLVVFGG
jgi:tRNA 2-thiouridine synthesizing protein D